MDPKPVPDFGAYSLAPADLGDGYFAPAAIDIDKNKVGSTKTVLYTPLVVYNKANLKNQFCWTLETIR